MIICSALPAEIQAAYVTLGWYKAMWEAQAEPDSEDMEWDELSAEQQTAAAALGYDKGTNRTVPLSFGFGFHAFWLVSHLLATLRFFSLLNLQNHGTNATATNDDVVVAIKAGYLARP
jgi:hypothetical protein